MCYFLRFLSLLSFSVLFIAGCDSGPADPPSEEPPPVEVEPLTSFDNAVLEVGQFLIAVDSTSSVGFAGAAAYWSDMEHPNRKVFVIYESGLWIAAESNGTHYANILCGCGTGWGSNYTRALTSTGQQAGIFVVTSDSLSSDKEWPSELGAPTDASGQPMTYGDKMLWGAFTSKVSNTALRANPLRDIRLSQSIYGYDALHYSDLVFVRYELTNNGNEAMDGIYLGYRSDTDLSVLAGTDILDRMETRNNVVAYDAGNELSYTYFAADTANARPDTRTYVTGYTLLGVDDVGGLLSHRVLRKNDYIDGEAFGEDGLVDPENVYNALRGLSSTGESMVNPVTGSPDLFAFSGDPVARTGWLDRAVEQSGGIDIRQLLTAGPFSLAPGETRSVTIAWAVGAGSGLSGALADLKQNIRLARETSSLWDFE